MNNNKGQFYLFSKRRFLPFFITQFLGALNDNLFKNALMVIVVSTAVASSDNTTNFITNLAAGLFILPFFLFSTMAGRLADHFDKAYLIRRIKFAEIILMLLGCFSLWQANINLMLAILFLLGVQSAFFGPIKYAIIPQHVEDNELLAANAQVGMGTFVSILLGTLIGGWLVTGPQGPMQLGALIILVAIVGWLSSCQIPNAPPEKATTDHQVSFNQIRETVFNYRLAKQNKTVLYCIFSSSWFWLYGACFLTQVPNFSVAILGGDPKLISILLGSFIIGVAIGSLCCNWLSRGRVEPGLVPVGTLGLSLFAIDLFFSSTSYAAINTAGEIILPLEFITMASGLRVLIDLLFIGLFGGLFIVPIYAMIQRNTNGATRARVLSVNNIFNALFMVSGSLLGMLFLSQLGWSIPQFFLLLALLNLAFMGIIFYLEPVFMRGLKHWANLKQSENSHH
ncbi:MAG: MFS transporter [Porticoccaceae bacterium]|nr:MFS transporter [Porticoccaceae bacterium]